MPLNEAVVDLKVFIQLCAREPLASQGLGGEPGGPGLLLLESKQPVPPPRSAVAKGAAVDLRWWRSVEGHYNKGAMEAAGTPLWSCRGQKGGGLSGTQLSLDPQKYQHPQSAAPQGLGRVTERDGEGAKPLETDDGCKASGC